MYNCQFSSDEEREIRYQRYRHPDPIVRKRMTILWHKHRGLPHHQIAELSDASPNTVTATVRTYLEKGLRGVRDRNVYRPVSRLDPHRVRLAAHFSEHPSRSLKEAAAEIKRLTGLSFTIAHVRTFLLSLGLSRKKLEAFPGSSTTISAKNKNHLLTIN
jgi:transposase